MNDYGFADRICDAGAEVMRTEVAAAADPAVCPLGIPADPDHDPVGPYGGPYVCECGWTQPMESVRLLLTGTVQRRDLDQVLEQLPGGITVTDQTTTPEE